MTGRLATKKGLFYCVLSYRDKNGDWKQKWIPTGLSERGNKKAAQHILQQTIFEYSKPEKSVILLASSTEKKVNFSNFLASNTFVAF